MKRNHFSSNANTNIVRSMKVRFIFQSVIFVCLLTENNRNILYNTNIFQSVWRRCNTNIKLDSIISLHWKIETKNESFPDYIVYIADAHQNFELMDRKKVVVMFCRLLLCYGQRTQLKMPVLFLFKNVILNNSHSTATFFITAHLNCKP